MNDEPELIATLQVGMAASGECPECQEIFMVKSRSAKPEPLSVRLRHIFEEHVRRRSIEKSDRVKRQFGLTGKGDADTLSQYRSG
jgi:hypothetical protein